MKKIIFSLLSILFCNFLTAEIREASSFKELQKVFDSLDRKSLVVFDVNKVLMVQDDVIGHPRAKQYYSKLKKMVRQKDDKRQSRWSQFLLQTKQKAVEPELVAMIQALQKRGVRVMVCTAKGAGAYSPDIPHLEDLRLRQLKEIGYDFSRAFHEHSPMILTTKKGERLFKDGIIFAGRTSKGRILCNFLKQVHFRPKKVLFFDDTMKNVKSVHNSLRSTGIESVCVCYNGDEKRPFELNPKLLDKQIAHFLSTTVWLGDSEIKKAP